MVKTAVNKGLPPMLSLIIIALVTVFFFYGDVLLAPNNYMFSIGGDGIKNYFTYSYHIVHNDSYTNFEGMNYPYGENYLYTDSHPVFAHSFKFLAQYFPFFGTNSVGLVNLLMISSIFFTFILIYLLLVEFNKKRWLSVIFTVPVAMLAPQLFRLEGHLALSYSVAIPLAWLLLLKYCNHGRRKFVYFLFANNLFWMFIHAYLGMVVLAFIISMVGVRFYQESKKKESVKQYLLMSATVIVPIIVFFVYSKLTDIHTGRTDNPSGFFLYNARIKDMLLPYTGPLHEVLSRISNGRLGLQWEASAYLGLPNVVLFVYLFLLSLISVFKKKFRLSLKPYFDHPVLNHSLLASAIVFLFAMGIPFKQMPFLLDWFPVFKQFRATGRFIWPFYFVFAVFAAYHFQKIILSLKTGGKKKLANVFIVCFVCLSIFDGAYYHSNVSSKICLNPNLFKEELLSEEIRAAIEHVEKDKYQAILAMPFFHHGSESFERPRMDAPVRNSIVVSYHTGLPMFGANLTRISIEESKRIIQLISPGYYWKPLKNDLPSDKPVLIVKSGNDFTKYEKRLLDRAKTVYENQEIELMAISVGELFRDERGTAFSHFTKIKQNLFSKSGFLVTDSASFIYYNDYEQLYSDTVFRGVGSFASIKKGTNTYAEFPPNTFEKGKQYDVSLWMFNGEQDALNLWFRLIIEEYDRSGNRCKQTTFFPDQCEAINGDWSLCEAEFSVSKPDNTVKIVTIGKKNSKASLHADDILVKSKGVDVYRLETDSCLFFNNHKICKQ